MEMEIFENPGVTRVCFDFAVAFCFEDGSEMRIESDFRLVEGDDTEIEISVSQPAQTSARVPGRFNRAVESATVNDSGGLELRFDDSASLVVDADDSYEAWNFNRPGGRKLICMPGGEIAGWNNS